MSISGVYHVPFCIMQLTNRFHFTPVAFETMGSVGDATMAFLDSLGAKIRKETGDIRSSNFLNQRISIAIQQGNTISVLGSLTADDL